MGTIAQLNELTTPATGDYLLASDASDATDKNKKVAFSKFGVLSLAQTWTAAQTFSAGITVSGAASVLSAVRSGNTGAITDDSVATIAGVPDPCMILFWPQTGSTPAAVVSFRPNAPATQLVATNDSANFGVTTGVLTGTTGTDTDVNVSCSGGTVYVENRRGFNVLYYYLILG